MNTSKMSTEPGTASEPQIEYIKGLLKKKDITPLNVLNTEQCKLTAEQLAWLVSHESHGNLPRLSKQAASNIIKSLLALNDKPIEPAEVITEANVVGKATDTDTKTPQATKEEYPTPDAGYYFINDPTDNNEPHFFRVQKGKEGSRWEGYTFLAIQASDYFYAIKSNDRRKAIFAEILKDPVQSMNEYGLRLGRCGVCNRTLTDRHSILRGIGPICAGRLEGQASEEDIDILGQLGLI